MSVQEIIDCLGGEIIAPKPVIELDITGVPLHDQATLAEEALVKNGAPFYSRGSTLVRPIIEEVEASRGRKTKVARLAVVGVDCMIDHLSRSIVFKRFNKRSKELVAINPPRHVAATILARDGEWTFKRIVGVLTAPTIRPDGSLLMDKGFDESTGLLLVDCPPMPPISERPSRDEALVALDLLKDLISEFPLEDKASESVCLSAIITPNARGAIRAAPLHATSAPAPGSGKSYLNDIVSTILTGQPCPVISAGKNDEETEKRLGAALLFGQPIISIDNVNGYLGGDALCQFVERPLVQIRPLGSSELISVQNRATIYATGNNITLVGDMVRRTVKASLDANSDRPELRCFSKDPLKLVMADRGKYIAAALTIPRAYIVAGFPDLVAPLNSFEEWSRLVRSALVWLGCEDPVKTMDTARDEDPDTIQLNEIVNAWANAIGKDQPKTVGELILRASNHEPLYFAFKAALNDVDTRRLGGWLKRRKGRVANSLKIVGDRDDHLKQMKWSLRSVAGKADHAGTVSAHKLFNTLPSSSRRPKEYPQIPLYPQKDLKEEITAPHIEGHRDAK